MASTELTYREMKTLIEMSPKHFDRLLAKCAVSDREYSIMKNGLLTPYGENLNSSRTVVILCKPEEANWF